jgi:hypothetical protein
LQWQVEIVVSLKLYHCQASAVRDRKQVQHAAVSGGECRDLRINDVSTGGGLDIRNVLP